MNIIQFCLWFLLLWIAFSYLTNHEAEQTNLKSSFDGISKKATLLREKYTSGKDALIETKFKLKQQMEELEKSLWQAQCQHNIDIVKLKQDIVDINDDTATEFEKKQDAYVMTTRQYYTLLHQYCK